MPVATDCVIDSDSADQTGPIVQVLAEAIPGQGVRRTGGHIAEGSSAIVSGRRIRPLVLLIARAAGLQKLNVRRPRLRVVNIPAVSGDAATAQLISDKRARAGGRQRNFQRGECARWPHPSSGAIDTGACDLLITTGGSGVGRTDATIAALTQRGEGDRAWHRLCSPAGPPPVGRIGSIPVIALPGAPDQALAAWWTPGAARAGPVVRVFCSDSPSPCPLQRKIASSVGIAEIVLLETK